MVAKGYEAIEVICKALGIDSAKVPIKKVVVECPIPGVVRVFVTTYCPKAVLSAVEGVIRTHDTKIDDDGTVVPVLRPMETLQEYLLRMYQEKPDDYSLEEVKIDNCSTNSNASLLVARRKKQNQQEPYPPPPADPRKTVQPQIG